MNRPVALVCYICGREFGTHSLGIHIKACEKKWENEQNLLPPKQRRPCPKPPKGFDELTTKGKITKEDINKFNAKSFDAFVEEALVQCEYCGRRFNQKSLIPHQKACKTNPMIRKPFVNKGALGKFSEQEQPINSKPNASSYKMPQYEQPPLNDNLVPCRRCGRKFNADRVGKHQNVCKGDKVEVNKKPQYKEEVKPSKMKPNFGKEKKAKWKIQHEELQNAMKMMRQMKAIQAKGGKISDLPPPPPSNYDHYIECKHCGRKYAPDVAERHIPKCANIINKPGGIKPSKIQQKYISGTGSGNKKWQENPSTLSSKPNMMLPSKSNITNANSYVKPPANNQFSDPYSNSTKNNYSYGGYQQTGSNVKSLNTNPFEKPTPSKVTTNSSKIPQKNQSSYKPNFNTKTNPSNYW